MNIASNENLYEEIQGLVPQNDLQRSLKSQTWTITLNGLVGTMAALVLGLLVASAKSSYDAQSNELTQASANIILLDRVLALYGPETKDVRETLRQVVVRVIRGQTRWLIFEQGATSVSKPMLVIMVFWLAIIFVSWGLFAPPNVTVVATLLVVAVSVSGSIFLILEMYSPYKGLIQISSAPLRAALQLLGQ